MTSVADTRPEPLATLRILIAPGDPTGYPIAHPYIDGLWLPILGPSAVACLRLVDRFATWHPDRFCIEVDELGQRLGLGGSSASGRTKRTIERLCHFGVAARIGVNEVVVPLRLPALTNRQLDRLPPCIAQLDREIRAPSDTDGKVSGGRG